MITAAVPAELPRPPTGILRHSLENVIQRRVYTAPKHAFKDAFGRQSFDVAHYLDLHSDHITLYIYPKLHHNRLLKRMHAFGQPFPGLYSINSKPMPIIKKPNADTQYYIGSVQLTKRYVTILGEPGGTPILDVTCAMDLAADTSVTMQNFRIRSRPNVAPPFNYKIEIAVIIVFGYEINVYNIAQYLDDILVLHFTRALALFQSTEVP